MDIDTKLMNDGALSYTHKTKTYILFNAWCKSKYIICEYCILVVILKGLFYWKKTAKQKQLMLLT